MTCQQVAGFITSAALGDETAMLVTLVYVADTLCCKAALGFNLTAITQELDMAALAEIGLRRAGDRKGCGKSGDHGCQCQRLVRLIC